MERSVLKNTSDSTEPVDSPVTSSHTDETNKPSVWEAVCAILKLHVGEDNFERIFRGVFGELINLDQFLVIVSNPIHQLWIESNYYDILTSALEQSLGRSVHIEFVVATDCGHDSSQVKAARRLSSTIDASTASSISKKAMPSNGRQESESMPQAPLASSGLNLKFSFDNFVIGANTSYSAAVARAVAEKPGRIYNPLFFHGATGLGKTHLLQSIGNEVVSRKRNAIVRYVTSEQFTNEFVEAIKKQTFTQFRQKYRRVDVLLIDDVHFFEGKDSTQEEFFHTFNEIFNNARQIVLASDRPPSELKNLESRLVSRFEWGLTTQIQVPDFETRLAILRRKQSDFDVSLEHWLLEFMAQRIRSNVRKLEGALMRVAAHVSLGGAVQTESALAALLQDVMEDDTGHLITMDRVQRIVAHEYDLRVSDLTGPRRTKDIAEARQVAMYLSRSRAKVPLLEIGRDFGGRDHGTVIHACKVVAAKAANEPEFNKRLSALDIKLESI